MVKKHLLSAVRCLFIYILILVAVISLCAGLNTNKRMEDIKSLFTFIDYNIIIPRIKSTKNAYGESERIQIAKKFYEREDFVSFRGDPGKVAQYYKTLSGVDGFILAFSGGSFAIDIPCSELPRFPDNYQMRYSYGQGMTLPGPEEHYNAIRKEYYEKGEDKKLQFCCMQIDYRIEGTYYLPLIEGELNDFTIKYSDYIGTDKPIPVVIGYDLRDLFELGEVVDALATFAIDRGGINPYEKYKDSGNAKIQIVGILGEEAYAMSLFGPMAGTQPVNTAIIMPFFDFTAGSFENEVDRNVFVNIFQPLVTNINLLTKLPLDEVETKFMKIAGEFGLSEIYSGIVVNSAYVVKGVSLHTYEKLTYTVFYSSLVLLSVSLIFSVITSVNNKIKKLSIHFLVGADKSVFLWKIITPFLAADILAGVSANLLFRIFSGFISEKIGDFLLKYNIIAYASAALCAGVGAFIILVAIIKINRTDFSRALKEA